MIQKTRGRHRGREDPPYLPLFKSCSDIPPEAPAEGPAWAREVEYRKARESPEYPALPGDFPAQGITRSQEQAEPDPHQHAVQHRPEHSFRSVFRGPRLLLTARVGLFLPGSRRFVRLGFEDQGDHGNLLHAPENQPGQPARQQCRQQDRVEGFQGRLVSVAGKDQRVAQVMCSTVHNLGGRKTDGRDDQGADQDGCCHRRNGFQGCQPGMR